MMNIAIDIMIQQHGDPELIGRGGAWREQESRSDFGEISKNLW